MRKPTKEILQENCVAEYIEFQKKISHENCTAKGIKSHKDISWENYAANSTGNLVTISQNMNSHKKISWDISWGSKGMKSRTSHNGQKARNLIRTLMKKVCSKTRSNFIRASQNGKKTWNFVRKSRKKIMEEIAYNLIKKSETALYKQNANNRIRKSHNGKNSHNRLLSPLPYRFHQPLLPNPHLKFRSQKHVITYKEIS